MARLLPTALAIAIVTGSSASHAGVILTEEDMAASQHYWYFVKY